MMSIARIHRACGWLLVGILGHAGCVWAQPKPNEPAHGWIPTPAFTSPAKHQQFSQAPNLKITLSAHIPNPSTGGYTIPAAFDFVAYAKASPFTEKWHIHLVKQGPEGTEVPLEKFEGLVSSSTFSLVLDGNWIGKHGPGKYAARAFLSQSTPKGADAGLATGVGFEILAPKVVRMKDQKPAPAVLGNPVATPPPGARGTQAGDSRAAAPPSQLPPRQVPPVR